MLFTSTASKNREYHHSRFSADIAHGVWQYWMSTGDDDFFMNFGAEIMLETARFWASRGAIATKRA